MPERRQAQSAMNGLAVFRIAMGARMVSRGELGGLSAAAGLATTGGAMAIDVAALAERCGSR